MRPGLGVFIVGDEGNEFIAYGRVTKVAYAAFGRDHDVLVFGEQVLVLSEYFSDPPLHPISLNGIPNFFGNGDSQSAISRLRRVKIDQETFRVVSLSSASYP